MSSMIRGFAALVLVLSLSPALRAQTSEDATIKQAHGLIQQKKYKDAEKVLKEAIKGSPSCADCWLQLAGMYAQFDDTRDSVDALDHAVKVASSDSVRAQAQLYRCQALSGSNSKRDLEKAEQDCRDVLKFSPKTGDAHLSLGLALIRGDQEQAGLSELKTYVEGWPDARNVTYARKVLANPKVAREAMAPEFAVTCEDGRRIASSDLTGKVVVIDFWATWCPACRAALPELKELVKKYPSDRLVVISSSVDHDEKAWHDYITKKEMTWPQVLDKDDTLTHTFNVNAFPTYIVIDSDGMIRKRIVGMNPQQSLAYQLKAELREIFESTPH